MSDLVPSEDIERVVGAKRHGQMHTGRAVSSEQRVYVLHSAACIATGRDLRTCAFSIALDRGIDAERWEGHEDQPRLLGIIEGRLVPLPLTVRM